MITALYLVLVGVSALLALSNWRLGILLMLFAGALQDPVRKMMPGAPGWMVLAFTPVLFAVFINLLLGPRNPWPALVASYPRLSKSLRMFVATLLLAGVVLLMNYGFGAWAVAAIGLIGYIFPLLAVLVGFAFVRSVADLKRFVLVYAALTGVLLVGGVFEYWQVFPGWRAVGTEALNMYWIRHVPGYIVKLTSGFYRSPDLLGWHAGLLVMLSLMMSLYVKSPVARVLWLLLAGWGSVILLISGRNKMIFMPPIFVATAVLAYLYKGNVNRVVTIAGAVGISLGIFYALDRQMEIDREYTDYVGVGTETATTRVRTHGFEAVFETYRQSGFFGEGLGSASTGARYGKAAGIRTWQESGPSKLMVELGVPGFLAALMVALAIVRALFGCLNRMPAAGGDGLLFVGLLGIVVANAASFLVSHQAYGDPFLVTLAGFILGMTLSAPRWAFNSKPGQSAA